MHSKLFLLIIVQRCPPSGAVSQLCPQCRNTSFNGCYDCRRHREIRRSRQGYIRTRTPGTYSRGCEPSPCTLRPTFLDSIREAGHLVFVISSSRALAVHRMQYCSGIPLSYVRNQSNSLWGKNLPPATPRQTGVKVRTPTFVLPIEPT